MLTRDWLAGYFRLYNPERHIPINLLTHKLAIRNYLLRRTTEDGQITANPVPNAILHC